MLCDRLISTVGKMKLLLGESWGISAELDRDEKYSYAGIRIAENSYHTSIKSGSGKWKKISVSLHQ